jgi:hypothetical protein
MPNNDNNNNDNRKNVINSSSSSSSVDILRTILLTTLTAVAASISTTLWMKKQKQAKKPMKQRTLHKTIVRKLYRRVWNQANQITRDHACSEYIHAEHILIDPSNPNPVPGVEAYCQGVTALRQALPSIKMYIDDMIEQGCKVAVQLSFVAGFGEKTAKWTGTAVMEFEDDLIVKTWINTDSISAMIQLGLVNDLIRYGGDKGGEIKKQPMRRDKQASLVAAALLGRTEAHPTEVLTGKEWLEYFDAIQEEEWEHGSKMSETELSLMQDDLTGLDVVV